MGKRAAVSFTAILCHHPPEMFIKLSQCSVNNECIFCRPIAEGLGAAACQQCRDNALLLAVLTREMQSSSQLIMQYNDPSKIIYLNR